MSAQPPTNKDVLPLWSRVGRVVTGLAMVGSGSVAAFGYLHPRAAIPLAIASVLGGIACAFTSKRGWLPPLRNAGANAFLVAYAGIVISSSIFYDNGIPKNIDDMARAKLNETLASGGRSFAIPLANGDATYQIDGISITANVEVGICKLSLSEKATANGTIPYNDFLTDKTKRRKSSISSDSRNIPCNADCQRAPFVRQVSLKAGCAPN